MSVGRRAGARHVVRDGVRAVGRGESLTWTHIIIIRVKINDFIYI